MQMCLVSLRERVCGCVKCAGLRMSEDADMTWEAVRIVSRVRTRG